MTEMVTSGSMSGEGKRSDGLLGEGGHERTPSESGAAGPARHRASPRLYTAHLLDFHIEGELRQRADVRKWLGVVENA